MTHHHRLFRGDNLEVLRAHVPDASVDLVYLDPPFSSGKDYSTLFATDHTSGATTHPRAFEDRWTWGAHAEADLAAAMVHGGRLRTTLSAFRELLGPSDTMAYLAMMAPRLWELRRTLKPTGSLYLHCDPTASHYLKILLDAVFGPGTFRNEIVWRYRRWPARSRQLQKMHDVLLFYSRSDRGEHVFQTLYGYEPLADSTKRTFGTRKQRADFSSGRRRPGTVDEDTAGPPLSDVWDVGVLAPISRERLGYPTQKPEALLERVIRASSEVGAVVLDPFCGCGTTLAVAAKLGRRFIGIDVSQLAVALVRHRFARPDFHAPITLEVTGEPRSLPEARRLARTDPLAFRCWALGLLGARPANKKRETDRPIDGRLPLRDDAGDVLVITTASPPTPSDARRLCAAVRNDGAAGGLLVSLVEPGAPTRAALDAATEPLEALTVGELLAGRLPQLASATAASRRAAS